MANLFELPRYIAVEGPIRVGKSTLARILAERLNAQRVMEPDGNPFLDSFYEGDRGAAFQAQFTFLVRRFEQLQALDLGPQSQKVVISDFIFEKDKLFACLNLNDQELDTYHRYYEHFFCHYTSSDLLIVNTSEIDFVDRNEDLQELLRKVTEPIKGTQYFLPLGGQDAVGV